MKSGVETATLLGVVDMLYAAALGQARWQDFLSALARMFEADNVFVCQIENRRRPFAYAGLPQPNRDRTPVSRYGDLIADDPRNPLFAASQARAVHCRMGVSDAVLRGSRVYREYLHALDIEYTIVAVFPMRDGLSHDIGLTRGRAGRPFEQTDCAALDVLVPHLARAFAVQRALEDARGGPPPVSAAPVQVRLCRETLQARLKLSPGQARLAELLATGSNVREIAATLRLTDNTVREYLKRIYRATGARGQADLVRLVHEAGAEADVIRARSEGGFRPSFGPEIIVPGADLRPIRRP